MPVRRIISLVPKPSAVSSKSRLAKHAPASVAVLNNRLQPLAVRRLQGDDYSRSHPAKSHVRRELGIPFWIRVSDRNPLAQKILTNSGLSDRQTSRRPGSYSTTAAISRSTVASTITATQKIMNLFLRLRHEAPNQYVSKPADIFDTGPLAGGARQDRNSEGYARTAGDSGLVQRQGHRREVGLMQNINTISAAAADRRCRARSFPDPQVRSGLHREMPALRRLPSRGNQSKTGCGPFQTSAVRQETAAT